jgi:hypothetical protein
MNNIPPFHENMPKLCLDMDDVIADWMTEADTFLNLPEKLTDGYCLPPGTYSKLTQHSRFYRNLPLLPGALDLVAWARDYTQRKGMYLAFLTALPHDGSVPFAAYDKSHWAAKHFPDIPVFFGPYSYDKHLHCNAGDILIDDRHENCLDWEQAGGIAHIYTNWTRCKEWIRSNLKDVV